MTFFHIFHSNVAWVLLFVCLCALAHSFLYYKIMMSSEKISVPFLCARIGAIYTFSVVRVTSRFLGVFSGWCWASNITISFYAFGFGLMFYTFVAFCIPVQSYFTIGIFYAWLLDIFAFCIIQGQLWVDIERIQCVFCFFLRRLYEIFFQIA